MKTHLCFGALSFVVLMAVPYVPVLAEAATPSLMVSQNGPLPQVTCGRFRVFFKDAPKVMKKITVIATKNMGFTSTGQQIYSVYIPRGYQGLVVPYCLANRSKEAKATIIGSFKSFLARKLNARFDPNSGLWSAS